MSTLTFYDTFHVYPTSHGLRTDELRRCADCTEDAYAREQGESADQDSPCECCGRTADQDSVRPRCHHDGVWGIYH